MVKYDTHSARIKFTVKESSAANGPAIPYIMFEPYDEKLEVLGDVFLSFDLREGTTYAGAQGVATFLNENIIGLSFTGPK